MYEIGCSSGFPFEGRVVYARWPARELPEQVSPQARFTIRRGTFAYEPGGEPDVVDWHLNFADARLFVAYASRLLAQDELQVAEHPVLGSIREALLARGMPAVTRDPQGRPTPVTITGVQRRCAINTQPDPAAGHPQGLYGNAFGRATEEQVRAATRALIPPTISHILAMAAPDGGSGEYRREEILDVLTTAFTGFLAAQTESRRLAGGEAQAVIHTGFWGCGAFGGNRSLMTILQALAADLAGVDVVFWASDRSGVEIATDARRWYEQVRAGYPMVDSLVNRLVEEKFYWGISDGN